MNFQPLNLFQYFVDYSDNIFTYSMIEMAFYSFILFDIGNQNSKLRSRLGSSFIFYFQSTCFSKELFGDYFDEWSTTKQHLNCLKLWWSLKLLSSKCLWFSLSLRPRRWLDWLFRHASKSSLFLSNQRWSNDCLNHKDKKDSEVLLL